jgi:hypothetical protein
MPQVYRGYLTIAFAIFAFASSIPGANATVFTNPDKLDPGKTVMPIPDGYSGTNFIFFKPYTIPFAFAGGPSGTLYEYVDRYPNVVDAAHPYGSDYHFGYEITLTSGDVSSFSVGGYAPNGIPFDVSVKQCSLPLCGGGGSQYGANGVEATEVSRTTDGDEITFSFSALSGAAHSAGLNVSTDATSYADPQAFFENSEGNIFSIAVAGPIASVPETHTWVMLATGFAGIAFLRLRTRNGFHSPLHRATSCKGVNI